MLHRLAVGVIGIGMSILHAMVASASEDCNQLLPRA